jgi:phage terminase large subunit-like protein
VTVTADRKVAFVKEQIVLADGRTVGDAMTADPWIEAELLAPAFALDEDGLPTNKLVHNELARGQGKSSYGAMFAVTEAVLEPGTDVVVAAGDAEQAAIILEHLDGYLLRNTALGALATKRGYERLFEGGSRIRVISSDAPTAWGLGGTHRRFRVIADELTVWRDEQLWSALISSTGKVNDAQSIILSNAGFDEGRSWQWRVREVARTEPWGRLYAPAGIVASWIRPEWVEQQRALLPPAAFERVIENNWSSGSGDFVTAEQWALCVDERLARNSGGRGRRAALDLGLTKDRTALAVVHRDGEYVVLDELRTWQGTRAEPVSITGVERAVVDATERYPGLVIAADPWQLKGSIERLQRAGVQIREHVFSSTSVQKLSTTLYAAISTGTLRVYPDRDLEREVLALRVVETAGGWRFDHRAGGYSDRAVALAMAVQLAQADGQRIRLRSYVPRGRLPGFEPSFAAGRGAVPASPNTVVDWTRL